ncbi:Rne/Rng family ribonuclease [Sorangium sp. So ce1335]|uniref:Rne/Rng family ribonuclease n=1 Tax=Sorangium sp. So ce1335 TaxID=3133335 RepID=UPI003F5F76A4
MGKNLLVINVDIRETRVALIENGIIAELHLERESSKGTLGNIYLGKVSRVLPGMQAAFIDVGLERAAFLHVEDLIRPDDFEAYLAGHRRPAEEERASSRGRAARASEAPGPEESEVHELAGAEAAPESPGAAAEHHGAHEGADFGAEEGFEAEGALEADGSLEDSGEETSEEAGEETSDVPINLPTALDVLESPSGQAFAGVGSMVALDEADDGPELEPEIDGEPERDSAEEDDDDEELVAPGGGSDADEASADDAGPDVASSEEDDELDAPTYDVEPASPQPEEAADVWGAAAERPEAPSDAAEGEAAEAHAGSASDAHAGAWPARSEETATAAVEAGAPEAAGDEVPPAARARSGRTRGRRDARVRRSGRTRDRRANLDGGTAAPEGASPAEARETPREGRETPREGREGRETPREGRAGRETPREGREGRETPREGREGRETPREGREGRETPREGREGRETPREGRDRGGRGQQGGREGRDRGGRDQRARERGRDQPRDGKGKGAARGQQGARTWQNEPPRISKSTPIREVVREGQEVIVQISKEPIGTKGARVTSHISLPGRYVVYLPTVDHIGISKRIGSEKERSRLREAIEAMKPPQGGLIVRTLAEGLTKKQLKADVGYLVRLWGEVAKKRESGVRAPAVLYTELDLVLKTARDLFTDDIEKIVIDDREEYIRLRRFVEMFMPERADAVELYEGTEPIFDAYGIEDEIQRALSRKVPLPSGGHLIIDQAEALTAIDVNTGRFVGKGSKDLEETILTTNLEAVEEIAYQLRFRNIGGLIILDLIDMERAQNREKVRRRLEELLARDKAKTTLNRISDLGLIEMTRKRTRESLGRTILEPCFYCDGTGQLQSKQTVAYEILRQIRRERMNLPGYSVVVNAHPAVIDLLKNDERIAVQEAERLFQRRIDLVPRKEYHLEQFDLQGR